MVNGKRKDNWKIPNINTKGSPDHCYLYYHYSGCFDHLWIDIRKQSDVSIIEVIYQDCFFYFWRRK